MPGDGATSEEQLMGMPCMGAHAAPGPRTSEGACPELAQGGRVESHIWGSYRNCLSLAHLCRATSQLCQTQSGTGISSLSKCGFFLKLCAWPAGVDKSEQPANKISALVEFIPGCLRRQSIRKWQVLKRNIKQGSG